MTIASWSYFVALGLASVLCVIGAYSCIDGDLRRGLRIGGCGVAVFALALLVAATFSPF